MTRSFKLVALAVFGAACAQRIQPPVPSAVSVKGATTSVGLAVQLDASSSSDPLGKPLTYQWWISALPAGSHAQLNDPGIVNPSFLADVPGDYSVLLAVSNGVYTVQLPAPVTVTATSCGATRPSIASVKATPANPNAGDVVQLTTDAHTPDTENPACAPLVETLSYAWELIELPAGSHAALNAPTAANPSFTADVANAAYTARLRVTDSLGHVSDASLLTVKTAQCGAAAPGATIAGSVGANPVDAETHPANVGDSVLLTPTVTDQDTAAACGLSHTYSYSWAFSSLPAGSAAKLNSTIIEKPSFTPDLAGVYVAKLTVTSSNGATSGPVTVTLKASACGGNAPVVATVSASTDGAAATPIDANIGQVVRFDANVNDADTDTGANGCGLTESFAYQWRLISEPAGSKAALNNGGAQSPSLVADVPGDYTVRVVVTASNGKSSAAFDRTITAAACGSIGPSIAVGQPLAVNAPAGSFVQLPAPVVSDGTGTPPSATPLVTVTDPDAAAVCGLADLSSTRYHWSFVTVPAGSAVTLNNADIANPSFKPDVVGAYTLDSSGNITSTTPAKYVLRVRATASNGLSATSAPIEIDVGGCGSAAPSVTFSALDTAGTDVTASSSVVVAGRAILLTPTVIDADTSGVAGCNGSKATESAANFSYAWAVEKAPAGSKAQLSSTTATTPSFTPDVPGAYTLRLVVVDTTGLASAPARVSFTSSSCGATSPSVSVASVPTTGLAIGLPITVTASVSGLDSTNQHYVVGGATCSDTVAPFAFAWSFASLPPGSKAQLLGAATASPSFIPDLSGTYSLQVAATDAEGHVGVSAPAPIVITSCGSIAPSVTLSQKVPTSAPSVNQPVSLKGTPTLGNSACVSTESVSAWSWWFQQLPAGSKAQLNGASGAQPTFTPDVPGTYVIGASATSSLGMTGLATPKIVTTNGSCGIKPPSFTSLTATSSWNLTGAAQTFVDTFVNATGSAGPSGSATTFQLGQPIALVLTASDQNTTASCGSANLPLASIAYKLVSVPAGSNAQILAGTQTASFIPDQPGTYVISATALDAEGNSASTGALTLTSVGTCGTGVPSLALSTAGCLLAATVGVPQVFSVSATAPASGCALVLTDADAGTCKPATYAYQWQLTQLPPGSNAFLGGAQTAAPSLVPDVATTSTTSYAVALTLTDSLGHRATSPAIAVSAAGCNAQGPSITSIGVTQNQGAANPATITNNAWLGVAVVLDAVIPAGSGACAGLTGPFNYRWQVVTAPAGSVVDLRTSNGPVATLTPDVAGTYSLMLTVSDNQGRSASMPASFSVLTTCTAESGPNLGAWSNSAIISAVTATLTQITSTTGAIAVPLLVGLNAPTDGMAACTANAGITYQWQLTQLPLGSKAFLSGNGLGGSSVVNPSFTPDVVGTYEVTVTLTNKSNRMQSSTSQKFTVSSPCGGLAPIANANGVDLQGFTQSNLATNPPSSGCSSATATCTNPPAYTCNGSGCPSQTTQTSLSGPANDDFIVYSVTLPPNASGSCAFSSSSTGVETWAALDYRWNIVSAPAGFGGGFDNHGASIVLAPGGAKGTYIVSLTVSNSSNGFGGSSTAFFTILAQ